ncbi:PAS domain-containing protein [Dongia sp.]|uniref:PAS domain-containing protein n=1 Tax=Dongia sp. TaxID=1977262 RepID=UPI0035AFD725
MRQQMQFDPDDPDGLTKAMAEMGMESPLIPAGFRYWNTRRAGRRWPMRADLDPVFDIPKLLPHIILFDVRHEPLDFRCRVVGSNVRENMSQNYVGRWFSDIPNYAPTSTIWPRHQLVAETGVPILQRPTYIGPHRDFIAVENILMPLAVPEPGWSMQLMFIDFVRRRIEDEIREAHRGSPD